MILDDAISNAMLWMGLGVLFGILLCHNPSLDVLRRQWFEAGKRAALKERRESDDRQDQQRR